MRNSYEMDGRGPPADDGLAFTIPRTAVTAWTYILSGVLAGGILMALVDYVVIPRWIGGSGRLPAHLIGVFDCQAEVVLVGQYFDRASRNEDLQRYKTLVTDLADFYSQNLNERPSECYARVQTARRALGFR